MVKSKIKKYVPVICAVFIVSLLGNCREGMTYEYDLIKVQTQKNEKEGVWASISPETKKRYMGAVIVNGSPFSIFLAIDHEYYNPDNIQIESILIKKKDSSELLLNIPSQQVVTGAWVNHGAFSSWEPNPTFSYQVTEKDNICIKLTLSQTQQDQFEVNECFILTREKGEAKMRLRDILNQ